jgi:hypothetical protein
VTQPQTCLMCPAGHITVRYAGTPRMTGGKPAGVRLARLSTHLIGARGRGCRSARAERGERRAARALPAQALPAQALPAQALPAQARNLIAQVAARGYEPVPADMTGFRKAGGGPDAAHRN